MNAATYKAVLRLKEVHVVHVWDVTIPELTGRMPRRAYLYLPGSYDYEPWQSYPVLYMFDGQNIFFDSHATYGKSWGLAEYLDYTQARLIVAAVACNDAPDNSRLQEYSPYTFDDPGFGHVEGLGAVTMDWLIHTFKANIDANFRTLSDREHTYLGGSSMGGLMSLYGVLAYNDVFSRAAALSPSLWTSPAALTALARTAHTGPDTVVYMDYGSEEMEYRTRMNAVWTAMTSILCKKKVFVTARIVPHGTHCEACWEKQTPFFMNTLLYE